MRILFAAAATSLLVLGAAPSLAQQAPPRPAPAPAPVPAQPSHMQHQQPMQARPAEARPAQTRPAQARPAAPAHHAAPMTETGPRPYLSVVQGGHDEGDMRYGRWESRWGSRPPAPPAHFSRHDDWYRHVRACQERYKSYNPRTDMYVARRGHSARCTL